MKLFKRYTLLGSLLFFFTTIFAQNSGNNNADQNGFMTSDGKIFVVMAVVVVIVIGLFLYLINLDRKITKLEKNIKE